MTPQKVFSITINYGDEEVAEFVKARTIIEAIDMVVDILKIDVDLIEGAELASERILERSSLHSV